MLAEDYKHDYLQLINVVGSGPSPSHCLNCRFYAWTNKLSMKSIEPINRFSFLIFIPYSSVLKLVA